MFTEFYSQVISPAIEADVAKALGRMDFFTLITDTSNHKSDKMLPVMVRGFDEVGGVKVFKLAVELIADEKSETMGNVLMGTGKRWKIENKVVAFGADNCVTNFGSVNRNGENNVFYRMKHMLGCKIVGVGCTCHIVHNAFDAACDILPISVGPLAFFFYKHFEIHTRRVEVLKEFCSDEAVMFSKPLSHSGTRFLSLGPAVKKVM